MSQRYDALRLLLQLLISDDLDHTSDCVPFEKVIDNVRIPLAKLDSIEAKLDALMDEGKFRECALSHTGCESVVRLLTQIGPPGRAAAVEYLEQCMAGSKQITVCDPFFLLGNKMVSPEEYVAGIAAVLPVGLKKLEVFAGRNKREKKVADQLNRLAKTRGFRLTCVKTNDIHDRVWIRDNEAAYAVGTSFNGLGNKYAFILPLPEEDRQAFLRALNDLRLSLPTSRSV